MACDEVDDGVGNGDGGGQDNAPSCSGSPKKNSNREKHKVKLLCSHGGRILPRPADDHLKYVGGETRVITFSGDITFSELMKKVGAVFDGEMVLKYQLIPEDLDALVSVRTDEDVKHMLEEYNRQENRGMNPRLRTFLFPSKPIMIESSSSCQTIELEQRYIDAVNGIVRSSPNPPISSTSSIGNCSSPIASFSISSACSSPKSASPEHHYLVEQEANQILQASRFSLPPPAMHKVQSSPSICGNHNYQQYHNQSVAHRHHQAGGYHYQHQNHQGGCYQLSRSLSRSSHPHNHGRPSGLGTHTSPHMSPCGRSETGSVRNNIGQSHSHHNSTCTSPRHQSPRPIALLGASSSYYEDSLMHTQELVGQSLPPSPRKC